MTERSYDNLPTMIGELKRAAIDAYMKSQGWSIESDKYNMSSTNASFDVTRPGSDGQGGGDWDWNGFFDIGDEGQDAKWRGAYDAIRSDIDATMERWLDLPDGSVLDDDVEQLRQANRLLSFAASGGTGGGKIGGYLTGIEENLSAMSGATISAFKAEFLLQLEKAIGGHHGITVILGGAMTASREIWNEARKTVADIVGETRDALHAYAHDSGPNWEVVLKVTGYAVEGVGLFATGGVSTALKGAALGLKVVTEVNSKKNQQASKPSLDYEGLIKGLGTSLDELADAIKVEEDALRDNLVLNASNVRADKSSYDLSRPGILDTSDHTQAEIIVINKHLVDEITQTYLPYIADELEAAAMQTFLATYEARRDGSIGIGGSGMAAEFSDLQWLLRDLLKDLAWETRNSAKSLELAIEDIGNADESTDDAMARHAKLVRDGSGYNPWD